MLMMQPLRRLMVLVRTARGQLWLVQLARALHALLPLRLAPALAALQGQQLIAFALACTDCTARGGELPLVQALREPDSYATLERRHRGKRAEV